MTTGPHPGASLGIDFGTTNSAVGIVGDDGVPRLAEFETESGPVDTYRSILYSEERKGRPQGGDAFAAGPEAIRRYRQAHHKGRFIQSLKAYLGDGNFTGTQVGGKHRTLEELIGLILQRLLSDAGKSLGSLPSRAVVGRPVHFTDARSAEDDQLAVTRLTRAFERAGITEPVFEYEPVAAAYAYQQRLTRPETVLIGDFGGGTSDFSILALKPADAVEEPIRILGNDGLAIGGDAFDRLIVRHAVAPQLGKGSHYKAAPDKILPTPEWVYSRLERWHHLSFLKSSTTIEMLERVRKTSTAPQALTALLHLVEEDLGYELHEQVTAAKVQLSSALDTHLHFRLSPVSVDWHGTREALETWLGPDLTAIERTVIELVATTGLRAEAIDTVFLTGGSSFVPAVRRIFERLFPSATLAGGHELTSVATGLALRAAALDRDRTR